MSSKTESLLNSRMSKSNESTQTSKMAVMAQQTTAGQRTTFGGMFGSSELSAGERFELEDLLRTYSPTNQVSQTDLHQLLSITAEVKAINNQAALLHGERIKRAQLLLKEYRDGAFTAWLIATYGNRQTPYNFLQYFEFCEILPKAVRPLIDQMPRQAIYTLASRKGSLEDKQEIIQNYAGETKTELLKKIRFRFPLSHADQRRRVPAHEMIQSLERLCLMAAKESEDYSEEDFRKIDSLVSKLKRILSRGEKN